jgi:integrase
MEVVKVRTEDNEERYYVADDEGRPIRPILKFIRFKDNTKCTKNTLRMYCQHLKLFFEYLEQRKLDFQEVTIDELILFLNWLQHPYKSLKVVSMNKVDSARRPRTVNVIINTVLAFYDYIIRDEEYNNNISDRFKKFVSTRSRNFKGFSYGIDRDQKNAKRNILRLKVPKSKIKILTKEEVTILVNTCSNFRDIFLLSLLYETGMRVGEALELRNEDFDIRDRTINLKETNAEIKKYSKIRRIEISQALADMFMKYIAEYKTEQVNTNHVFIKIIGEHRGTPMKYIDIVNLFRTLKRKTGIDVTPSMLRNSSATFLRVDGWEPEMLREGAGYKNNYSALHTYIYPSDKEIIEEFNKVNLNLGTYNERNK